MMSSEELPITRGCLHRNYSSLSTGKEKAQAGYTDPFTDEARARDTIIWGPGGHHTVPYFCNFEPKDTKILISDYFFTTNRVPDGIEYQRKSPYEVITVPLSSARPSSTPKAHIFMFSFVFPALLTSTSFWLTTMCYNSSKKDELTLLCLWL